MTRYIVEIGWITNNKYNIPENIDLTEIGAYAQKMGHSEMAV